MSCPASILPWPFFFFCASGALPSGGCRQPLMYMTAGYLLQMLVAGTAALGEYSHIVLDEVHERPRGSALRSPGAPPGHSEKLPIVFSESTCQSISRLDRIDPRIHWKSFGSELG